MVSRPSSLLNARRIGTLTAMVFALTMVFQKQASAGETIIYSAPGDYLLDTDPIWSESDSLFPASGPTDNTVTVTGTAAIPGYVYGGADGGSQDVSGNKVFIQGGTTGNYVSGGGGMDGNVYNNTVTVSGGTIGTPYDAYVNGGFSRGSGQVYGNTVIIEGNAVIEGYINGGLSYGGGVNDNTAIINSGTIGAAAYGGYTYSSADAYGNSLTINGGDIGSSVAGALGDGGGAVHDNTVVISGGSIQGGHISGGRNDGGTGKVYGNSLTISGGDFSSGAVFHGGWAAAGGDADSNTVTITGSGTFASNQEIYGGLSDGAGSASNNSVSVSNISFLGNIYGGASSGGAASGNNVDFAGTIGDTAITGGQSTTALATNNNVTIREAAELGTGASLIGGSSSAGYDSFSGNTLIIEPRAVMTLGQVNNFENYTLTLPAGFHAGDTLISITGSTPTTLNNPIDTAQLAKFTLNTTSTTPLLNAGDYFTVIDHTTMNGAGKYESTVTGLRGIGLQYTYQLETESLVAPADALIATVTDVGANPDTKPITHVVTGPATFLNQAADFAINQGFDAALNSLPICPDNKCGDGVLPIKAFGLASYSSVRQKADGHVDVDGLNAMVGLSIGNDNCDFPITTAMFFEAGTGDYNSTGNVDGGSSIKGKGDLNYYGGGILAKAEKLAGNTYLEGSFRFGRYESEYRSDDFYVPDYLGGKLPNIDVNSNYYGAHAGVGYVFGLNERLHLDTSVKYLWQRLEGDSQQVLGENFHFDDFDSQRVQVGGRLSWDMEDSPTKLYVGARYEYEFDGKSSGSVEGVSLPSTDMKDSTGLFDVGFKWCLEQHDLSVEAGLTGMVGQREGFGGHASVVWNF